MSNLVGLAWTAGFFDVEGTTVLLNAEPKRPRDYPTDVLTRYATSAATRRRYTRKEI